MSLSSETREITVEALGTEGQEIFLNREREEERQRHRERERGRRNTERREREATDLPTRGRRQRRHSLHHVTCSSSASDDSSEASEEEPHQQELEPETPAQQLANVLRHNEKMLGSLRGQSMEERIRNAKPFIDAKGRVLGHIVTKLSESG